MPRTSLPQDGRADQPSDTIDEEDICGFCGEPRADKLPHPVRWPGEKSAGTELVHAACEQEECGRAHACLSDSQRVEFLKGITI